MRIKLSHSDSFSMRWKSSETVFHFKQGFKIKSLGIMYYELCAAVTYINILLCMPLMVYTSTAISENLTIFYTN